MTPEKQSMHPTSGYMFFLNDKPACIQTLTIMRCSICLLAHVIGWPDWKVDGGKLVAGSKPSSWIPIDSICSRCGPNRGDCSENKPHNDLTQLVNEFIGDVHRKWEVHDSKMIPFFSAMTKLLVFLLDQDELQATSRGDGSPSFGDFDVYVKTEDKEIAYMVEIDWCKACETALRDCSCSE